MKMSVKIPSFKEFLNEFELEGENQKNKWEDYVHDGNISIISTDLKYLPKFPEKWDGMVTVMFNNNLESLRGLPKHVKKAVTILNNDKIKNLIGSPQTVDSSFNISMNNQLKSLIGLPKQVKQFKCVDNGKKFTNKDIKDMGVKTDKIILE